MKLHQAKKTTVKLTVTLQKYYLVITSFHIRSGAGQKHFLQGNNSPVLIKFPHFSRYFPGGITFYYTTWPEVGLYRQAYVYSRVNIVALLAVHLVHVSFT